MKLLDRILGGGDSNNDEPQVTEVPSKTETVTETLTYRFTETKSKILIEGETRFIEHVKTTWSSDFVIFHDFGRHDYKVYSSLSIRSPRRFDLSRGTSESHRFNTSILSEREIVWVQDYVAVAEVEIEETHVQDMETGEWEVTERELLTSDDELDVTVFTKDEYEAQKEE